MSKSKLMFLTILLYSNALGEGGSIRNAYTNAHAKYKRKLKGEISRKANLFVDSVFFLRLATKSKRSQRSRFLLKSMFSLKKGLHKDRRTIPPRVAANPKQLLNTNIFLWKTNSAWGFPQNQNNPIMIKRNKNRC